jgi:hypothetical protein
MQLLSSCCARVVCGGEIISCFFLCTWFFHTKTGHYCQMHYVSEILFNVLHASMWMYVNTFFYFSIVLQFSFTCPTKNCHKAECWRNTRKIKIFFFGCCYFFKTKWTRTKGEERKIGRLKKCKFVIFYFFVVSVKKNCVEVTI